MTDILGLIANPQMADIAGAIDYREQKMARDEAKRKQIRMNELMGKALSSGLQEGSVFHSLATGYPEGYIATSKAMGIDPADGSGMNQMTRDVYDIHMLNGVDPTGAKTLEFMEAQRAKRSELGLNVGYFDKGIAAIKENPGQFMRASAIVNSNLNPAKAKEDFTLGDTRYDGNGNVIASNPRGAGTDRAFRGEIVDSPDGSYVYSGVGNTVEPLLDPSGKQVRAARYDAESVGNIAGSKTRAEVTTKQSLDLAKDYFEKIAPINNYIANYDDAARLIDEGADTGKIESLLPSFRQASIELDNVQRSLGLNVVGNTTFGALSKGELDLALDVGLPTRLEGKELKAWISRKKAAQVKMRNYLEKAVSYLGEGNTIADLSKVQKQDREKATEDKKPTASTQETAAQRLERLMNANK